MRNKRLILVSLLFVWITPCAFGAGRKAVCTPESLYTLTLRRDVTPEKFVYNWRDAVLMKALIDMSRRDEARRPEIEAYVADVMTRLAPSAHGRHPNGVAAGIGFSFLQEIGRNTPETDEALRRVLVHYKEIPRAENGACSHRGNRVELWDDSLYMLEIFLLQCYRSGGDWAYVTECVNQVLSHAAYLRDAKTGLWYHGWSQTRDVLEDGCCQRGWNANPLQRNDEFWGRGNGWVAMTLVDLLEVLPKDTSHYDEIKEMYLSMMQYLRCRQDGCSGAWRQLPARPPVRANFPESSCTAMFAYAMAKGERLGLLPSQYRATARKAYTWLSNECLPFPEDTASERTGLLGVCEGTCIGDRNYYYSRRRMGGQTYATGAFLMLYNELNNNQ